MFLKEVEVAQSIEIISWNVNGILAVAEKGAFDWLGESITFLSLMILPNLSKMHSYFKTLQDQIIALLGFV